MSVKHINTTIASLKFFISCRYFILQFILGMEHHNETELKVSPIVKIIMVFGVN